MFYLTIVFLEPVNLFLGISLLNEPTSDANYSTCFVNISCCYSHITSLFSNGMLAFFLWLNCYSNWMPRSHKKAYHIIVLGRAKTVQWAHELRQAASREKSNPIIKSKKRKWKQKSQRQRSPRGNALILKQKQMYTAVRHFHPIESICIRRPANTGASAQPARDDRLPDWGWMGV